MITSYDKTKDEVLKCYDDFLEIVRQSGFSRQDCLFTALEKQADKIKSDKFRLMVAGEAKVESPRLLMHTLVPKSCRWMSKRVQVQLLKFDMEKSLY